jgi:small subunit ribosomal protein S8
MTDPIADMLTRIRNAYMAGKKSVQMPYSKLKANIAQILKKANYISDSKMITEGSHKNLHLSLKYINNKPAINHIERISKPGRRVYSKVNHLSKPLSGYGLAIISTSSGVMSVQSAREKNLGGELICKVW